MKFARLDSIALQEWVDGLIRSQKVYGVQAKADLSGVALAKPDRFIFAELAKASDLRLDYDVTLLPPKYYFQPPCEVLLEFSGSSEFKSVLAQEKIVLLGVHPYDMAAVNQMDKIFSSDNYDAHYMNRRRNAVIIGCDVQNPSPNVFAGYMNTAVVRQGFDILLTYIGDGYLAEALTEQGNRLMEDIKDLKEADAKSVKLREEVWKKNRLILRRHELHVPLNDLSALLERSYDHPVWEEKGQKCFSCGSCNLVCPTCYCFDVRDEMQWDLRHGVRCRVWDGCLLRDFATVSGGHNFRRKKAERYRHRYYRKGKYVPEKIGEISCVGCGRCIAACVPKIANPVEVYNRLLEAK